MNRRQFLKLLGVVRVTGVWEPHGYESTPYECVVNESGYVELPQIPSLRVVVGGLTDYLEHATWHETDIRGPINAYRIYAALHGFEKTGPWYFLREVSYRDAKRARFTVAADHKDSDLVYAPRADGYLNKPLRVTFPKPDAEQSHWMMYGGGGTPIGIFA